jgi:lipopolysaccharide biosynthesis regulator YciM
MDIGEQTLLAVLVALVAGIAAGRLWAELVHRTRRQGVSHGRSSIHYILGLDLLASRQIDRAVSELIEAARENTEATEIYLILGNLLREKGQLERAIQIHQSILHRPGLPASERTHALLCLGMDFKRAGFRNRAMETFNEVVALEPNNAYALRNLVKIHEEEQDWEKALDSYAKLSRVTGEEDSTLRAFLYDQIGQAAWRASEEQRALRAFDESARSDPTLPPAYLHHGDLLLAEDRREEAEAKWMELTKVSPQFAYLVFDRLEEVRSKLGRSDEMETLYRRVIELDDTDWRARLSLARLVHERGDLDAAFDLLFEAVRNNPHALAVHLEAWKLLSAIDGASGWTKRYLEEVSHAAFFLDPFVCIKCNYRANGVLWRCPHCQEWNSFVEERLERLDQKDDES